MRRHHLLRVHEPVWHTTNRVTSYQQWLDQADLRSVYAAHRRWLQYFQWAVPGDRWVLKSPGHLWALDALLAIYPTPASSRRIATR